MLDSRLAPPQLEPYMRLCRKRGIRLYTSNSSDEHCTTSRQAFLTNPLSEGMCRRLPGDMWTFCFHTTKLPKSHPVPGKHPLGTSFDGLLNLISACKSSGSMRQVWGALHQLCSRHAHLELLPVVCWRRSLSAVVGVLGDPQQHASRDESKAANAHRHLLQRRLAKNARHM